MNAFFIFGVTMKKGQHLFIFNLIILLMIAPCAVATTLTLQIVQVDKIHSDVTDSSLLIEESIFDYLFSKGYIVTSSPVATDLENSKEENIIVSHMFPMGEVKPNCKESWIVTLIDKIVALYECGVYKVKEKITLMFLYVVNMMHI